MREGGLGMGGGRNFHLLASGDGPRVMSDLLRIESGHFCVTCFGGLVGDDVLLKAGEFLGLTGLILLFRLERELTLSRTFFTQVLGL